MSATGLEVDWAAGLVLCGACLVACGGRGSGDPTTGAARAPKGGHAVAADGAAPTPQCTTEPTELVDFRALAAKVNAESIGATALGVDATNVYFVFNSTLMRAPLRGGPVDMLLWLGPRNLYQDGAPVVTSTSVILHYTGTNGDSELIVSVPVTGGSPTTLATSNGRVVGFTANDDDAYFIDQDGIKDVPTTGGDVRVLTDQVTAASGGDLAIVGSVLVVTAALQGTVVSVPREGGPPTTLATGQPNASFPLACGSDTCWWTGATPPGIAGTPGPGAVERRDSSGKLTSLPNAPYFPWSLVFDGTDFFETVGADVSDGSLIRFPAAGGPSVKMGSASFVVVDDACAYRSVMAGIFSTTKSYVAQALP